MGLQFAGVCAFALVMATCVCADINAVARSSQLFTARAYQELKSTPGNLLFCPISVQSIMALVHAGAKGGTADEIQRGLFLPNEKTTSQKGYEELMKTLNNANGVEMDIANKVYVADGYTLKEDFKQIATNTFSAGVENINFSKSKAAADSMNSWVEQKTHEKIKNLISADSLDSSTRMVLINALYFKGSWKTKFEAANTKDSDFWVSESKSIQVPMMSMTSRFKYAENQDLDCKFLEMPYEGGEYAMTIVLPNKRDGLAALENRIAEVLQPQNYGTTQVEVMLPKFKVETTIQFHEILKKMGMTQPFSDVADFSGLLESTEPVAISKIIQKNFINVTEEGTEAASATAVDLMFRSAVPEPEKFLVDHPFLYVIQESNSSVVIFMGRFEDSEIINNEIQVEGKSLGGGSSAPYCNTIFVVLLFKFVHFIF